MEQLLHPNASPRCTSLKRHRANHATGTWPHLGVITDQVRSLSRIILEIEQPIPELVLRVARACGAAVNART